MTQAGNLITDKAKSIIQMAKDIENIAQGFQNPYAGKFVFGAFPTLAPFVFPKIIPDLGQSFPDMTFYLTEDRTDILLQKLKSTEIDMTLLALPINDDSLQAESLFFDPFYVAISRKHPLSSRQQINLSDLKSENLMLLEDGHCLSDQTLDICQWHLISDDNANFRATSIETLRQMVASNLGITLIPKSAILPSDTIKYIPLSDRNLGRSIALIWRRSSPFQEVFRALAKNIKNIIAEN
jgi:LysR family hydrogen peroxide-inducible transcriptional activator